MTRAPTQAPRRRSETAGRSRWVRARIYLAAGVMGLLLLAIGYKAYGIQIDDASRYREMARRQHLRTLEVPAPRGVLFDTRGRELAVTAEVDSIFASPNTIEDVTGTAEALAEALDLDLRELEAKLSSPRHFVWIARHVAPDKARLVADLDLPGVEITAEPRRYYPGSQLAGPVVGFANIDGKGIEGVERAMNELLEGVPGQLRAVRDARGRVMLSGIDAGDVPGASVYLSLDQTIQYIAETQLARAVELHKAAAGVAVVLEIGTGRVLAMANLPTYDPNQPGSDARRGARNRAITDVYEIGSSMKVFTVAAALEAGAIRPNQVFDVEKGRIRVGRKWIRDSYRDDELDVTGIIRRSSNVGAIKIARKLGAEALHEALGRYGFGDTTGVELPGERAGVLRPPQRWGEIGLATASFGYGMSATALQVAAGFAAIANRGVYHAPRVVREVRDAEGKVMYQHEATGRQMMDPGVAETVRVMLGSVFDRGRKGGTARDVYVEGYTAGGKTGTAYKVDHATGRYADHLYLSSFAGIAPLEDPRIAIVVLIDEPGGDEHYGGVVAGPVFAGIASESLRYLGVPQDRPEEADASPPAAGGKAAEPEPEPEPIAEPAGAADLSEALTEAIDGVRVPDFRGLGMATVLERARAAGVSVQVVGTGRAVSQTPEPGVAAKGAKCRVVFEPGYR